MKLSFAATTRKKNRAFDTSSLIWSTNVLYMTSSKEIKDNRIGVTFIYIKLLDIVNDNRLKIVEQKPRHIVLKLSYLYNFVVFIKCNKTQLQTNSTKSKHKSKHFSNPFAS